MHAAIILPRHKNLVAWGLSLPYFIQGEEGVACMSNDYYGINYNLQLKAADDWLPQAGD